MQAMLVSDYDPESDADPRSGVTSVAKLVSHARVLHVGVIANGLLCEHGGDSGGIGYLLASQQSSMKTMGSRSGMSIDCGNM